MEFGILGPLEVREGERTIALGSSQQRTVLATLLLSANRPVSVDRLIEALWGNEPPGSASAVLKNRVSQLRKLLAPVELSTEPSGYLLRIGLDELDLNRFERLTREGRDALAAGHLAVAASSFAEALALWRGPALADFAYEEFAQAEIGRLEELRLATLEERLEADQPGGRAAELVPELEALCEEHPLRERLRKQLMLALDRSGRQADALEAYQAARQVLIEGLGIEPSPELKDLHQQILNQDQLLAAPEVQPVRDVSMTNLSIQPTALIGREDELGELSALLCRDDVRLVTLTGPGGTGKTRLAAQLAGQLMEQYPQGVYFVSLASIRDTDLVVPTIAQTLGLHETGEEAFEKTLATYLQDKTMLLVLDNFEQIVDAAPKVGWLLANSRGLNVLATSRTPLHLSGEHDYGVPPLRLPDPGHLPDVAGLLKYEAVALFVERARAVKAGFTVTSENAADVARICLRLDGLPLALELAAARIRSLPPQALLARLDERLKLLTGGARDLEERQRTLRGTIDWSYDLLSTEERTLFVRLGVFVGGCRLDAAEAVCDPYAELSDLVDGLSALVEKSLLRERDDPDGEPRYWMLETIREYALDRVKEPGAGGEERELRDRHAGYYAEFAERAYAESRGAEQGMWLQRLESDHDNLRAALDWTGEIGDSEVELSLVGGVWRFWRTRGHLSEGGRRLGDALDRAGDEFPELRARALKGAAIVADRQGAHGEAMRFAEESHELYRALGDDRDIAYALATLGTVAASLERFEQSEEFFEEALRLAREVGDAEVLGIALANLGDLALSRGDNRRARALSAESLDLDRERGDIEGQAISLFNVGLASIELEEPEEGEAALGESLTLFHQLGSSEGISYCLEALAAIASSRDRGIHSARLLAAAESLREALGISLRPAELDLHERTLARLHVICDADAFEEATEEGRTMTIDQAVELAVSADLSRDSLGG